MQTLVSFGDAIKADDSGRVRGYLVRFGGADLEGDYFTSSTDFGRPMKSGDRVAMNLYYHHGQDRTVGKSRIGTGYITMDDKGLWYEAQVEMADQYQKMIQELAKSGKLGYSSGATGHMVERKKMSDGRYEITRWPIGEASLTPTPAEYRNSVKTLKEYYGMEPMMDMDMEEMVMPPLPEQSAVEYAAEIFKEAEGELIHEGLEAYFDALSGAMEVIESADMANALIDAFAERAKGLYAMHGKKCIQPASLRGVERRLRDAVGLSRTSAKRLAPVVWDTLRDADQTPQQPEVVVPEVKASTDQDARQDMLARLELLAQL